MGGNGTHIGSTANVFIVTISEKMAKDAGILSGDHARFMDEKRTAGDAGYADNVHHNHVCFLGLSQRPLRPLLL